MESREGIFPVSFAWGTAASAMQGDGAGEQSDWRIRERSGLSPVSGRGNNRRERYEEDFLRLAECGLRHFRTSLDWARLEPQKGMYNREAIEDVRQLLEAADRRGLTVWLDLHHFDLPAWFGRMGGFMEETAMPYWHRFVEFAAKELGSLAQFWIPIHEPFTYAACSHLLGRFPPGKKRMDKFNEMIIRVHQAHGDAYRILKTYLPAKARVGIAALVAPVSPCADNDIDRFGANFVDNLFNRVSFDAVKHGAVSVPGRGSVEVPLCRGAADFVGIDYFFRLTVGHDVVAGPSGFSELGTIEGMPRIATARPGEPLSEEGYGAAAAGLYDAIKQPAQSELELPIYITAAGIATTDEELRSRYLAGLFVSLQRAVSQGLDVRGCLLWSDVDGYEMNGGYNHHYGLCGFDPVTFERKPRPAANLVTRVTHERRVPEEFMPPPEPEAEPEPPSLIPEY